MLRRPSCDGRRHPTGRCTHCSQLTYGRAAVCRRRRCPGYSRLWAGDQRRKLVENLAAYEGESVVLLAVTAPGADQLPWDEDHCRPLDCRVHPLAAREWNQSASDRWRRLHRRAYQAVRRHGVRSTLLVRAFERQRRGVLHVHPVLGFATPAERHAAHLYAGYLQQFAAHYGFGFTERRLRKLSAKAAAAYLSTYFVTGRKGKESLQESVLAPDMPRSIIHVSTDLTQRSGVTMRELRFRRFVWFIARAAGTCLEEARQIALQAVAGTLDLTADAFLPSPRLLAQVLGREPPPVRA